jgi:NAD(P)-dependent dehydrogenase (short-subunit alcohol dehydrogenase family)
MINLFGHTAFITGSTQGVGRSIAEACAEAGANVLLHGLETARGAEVVERCRAFGVQAELIHADLLGELPLTTDELCSRALSIMPAIDILVNNAGTYRDKPFLEMDWGTYDATLRLNVAVPYFLTQAFTKRWLTTNTNGRVLMVGSINGQLAEPTHTCYDTSKGALLAMVKSLCVTLAPLGMRVNGIAPGLVRTPLTSIVDRDERFRRWMELHTPNRQVPHSDVCGDAAVFLVSDAATHIQGQMLLIDGGMSVWQQPDLPENWG